MHPVTTSKSKTGTQNSLRRGSAEDEDDVNAAVVAAACVSGVYSWIIVVDAIIGGDLRGLPVGHRCVRCECGS